MVSGLTRHFIRAASCVAISCAFLSSFPPASASTVNDRISIASQYDQGTGGFYTEGLGNDSARITLSGATFDAADDYSPITVKNVDGEIVETLPSEVVIDGKQFKASYELESPNSVVMRVTDPRSEEKGIRDRAKCVAKNTAGGAVGGCIAGAIPSVGFGCVPGAVGGGIIGLSTGVFTC